MNTKSKLFRLVDLCLLGMILLPLAAGIALQVLTQPASGGLEISGAYIYCTIPLPFQELPITESQVNSWLVMVSVLGLCLYLTHGLAPKAQTRRQLAAEWIVEKADGLVRQNMGEYFKGFATFIAAILALSAFSSLLSLIGLYPPTSDLNVVGGWALLVFFLITFYRFKAGPVQYLKAFADPPLLAPLNVISEVATPVSMAFRHYGNVLSGSIISALVATALQGLSAIVLGWLPGVLGQFPLLQIGLPAILSVYFDLFSGYLQAFIFAMLTMLYVAGAFPADAYAQRQARKQRKTQPHTN